MKNKIYNLLITSILATISLICVNAQQVSYERQLLPKTKKLTSINFGDIEDPYAVALVNQEAPSVSGNSRKAHIATLKQEIDQRYPKNDSQQATTRDDALPPTIETGFLGNSTNPGIPLDNSLAMNGDQIISAINFHVAVKDPEGGVLKNFSLAQFAANVGIQGTTFDPRLLYDPEADRFILVALNGFSSNMTNIIIAFSDSPDATETWNVYSLTGNPNSNTTWTDYPMITVNETDLIVTGNLIRDGETWQEGFDETVLWQIDKQNGYDGVDLTTILYQDIAFDNTSIRNLCPAESSDEDLEPNTYFLSDRNFSFESDSFFLVELTGGINDPNTALTIELLQSDIPYGVPPNAEQRVNQLQTNDARVLEVFHHNNELQFVGNTRNMTNNKAGIFHARVMDLTGSKETTLHHIIGEDYEVGYPAITYVGTEEGDRDVIINFNHSSPDKDPGMSAMYWHPDQGYSEIIDVWNGSGYIAMLNGTLQRWGDYSGSQRDFNDGSACWISGFYGAPSLINFPWVAKLRKPTGSLDTDNQEIVKSTLNVFPNPISSRFQVEFEIPQGSKEINISLVNNNGQLVSELLSTVVTKYGETIFSFDQSNLPKGLYHLLIQVDQHQIVSEKVIVE